MADTRNSIFNNKAQERLKSPDDLDKYVRVTNPSVWAILIACIALLVGLFAWGIFGAVSTNVSATGVVVNGAPTCYLQAGDVARVDVGDSASVGGEQMTVASVATVPLSRDEAGRELNSDYLASVLIGDDWVYEVTFEDPDGNDLAAGVPLSVNITTDRVAPISLILK